MHLIHQCYTGQAACGVAPNYISHEHAFAAAEHLSPVRCADGQSFEIIKISHASIFPSFARHDELASVGKEQDSFVVRPAVLSLMPDG
jgi:hypothetical protein